MAAGQGYIEFATGDVLTAAAANGYLASQVVMVFADAAARTAAIASPQEGMISYLKDTNSTEYYSGSAWVAIGGSSTPTLTGVSLYKSANQSIATATSTQITWDSERWDTNGFHDTSTNNQRITIPSGKAGYYQVNCYVSFANNTSGVRSGTINKNGSTAVIGGDLQAQGAGAYTVMIYSGIVNAAVGDYFTANMYQNSGGNLNVVSDIHYSFFQMTYLGA